MKLAILLEEQSLKKRALEFQQLVLDHVHDADIELGSERDQEGEYLTLKIKHAFLDCTVFIQPNEVGMEHNGTEIYLGDTNDIEDAFIAFYPSSMTDTLKDAVGELSDVTDIDTFMEDNTVVLEAVYDVNSSSRSVQLKWVEQTQCFVDDSNGDELESVAAACSHIQSRINRVRK